MSTCPRCGHVADGELVCSNCGLSLAGIQSDAEDAFALMDDLGFEDDRDVFVVGAATPATGTTPATWRVATFAIVTILLIGVTAIFLINTGGGSGKTPVAEPSVSQTSTIPVGLPDSQPPTATSTKSVPQTHLPPLGATPSARSSGSSSSASSSSPSSSGASSAPGSSTSSSPPQSSSPQSSTPPPPPPTPSVTLAQGSPAARSCHKCVVLAVTLVDFAIGPHAVTCFSSSGGAFMSYTTVAMHSADCAYPSNGASVWVVVDGKYKSNVVVW